MAIISFFSDPSRQYVLFAWLLLTALYVLMVPCGGAKWVWKRDIGPFGGVPPVVWEKLWRFIWFLGTAATICALVLSAL
jgi:hypothetical protein